MLYAHYGPWKGVATGAGAGAGAENRSRRPHTQSDAAHRPRIQPACRHAAPRPPTRHDSKFTNRLPGTWRSTSSARLHCARLPGHRGRVSCRVSKRRVRRRSPICHSRLSYPANMAGRTISGTCRTVGCQNSLNLRCGRARKPSMARSKGNDVTFPHHIQPPSDLEFQNNSDLTNT